MANEAPATYFNKLPRDTQVKLALSHSCKPDANQRIGHALNAMPAVCIYRGIPIPQIMRQRKTHGHMSTWGLVEIPIESRACRNFILLKGLVKISASCSSVGANRTSQSSFSIASDNAATEMRCVLFKEGSELLTVS